MNRRICTLSLIGLGLFPACREDPYVTELLDYPEMVFTSQWIEFGEADQGEDAVRSFTIQNTGDLDLGISAIYLGAGHDDSFSLAYDPSTVTCPDADSEGQEATAKDIDTAQGGDTATEEPEEEAPSDSVIALGSDCRLSIDVTFNPGHVGKSFWFRHC